jgi:hypothetical protein
MVFEKNAIFSPKIGKNRPKLAKIAENCDHNIDPCFIALYVRIGEVPDLYGSLVPQDFDGLWISMVGCSGFRWPAPCCCGLFFQLIDVFINLSGRSSGRFIEERKKNLFSESLETWDE